MVNKLLLVMSLLVFSSCGREEVVTKAEPMPEPTSFNEEDTAEADPEDNSPMRCCMVVKVRKHWRYRCFDREE